MKTKFSEEMIVWPSPLLEDGYDFSYHGEIAGSIARFDNEINIQAIQSRYPGKGYCQKFIKEFQKDCKKRGLELVSSHPISPAWEHICKKFNIKTYKYHE